MMRAPHAVSSVLWPVTGEAVGIAVAALVYDAGHCIRIQVGKPRGFTVMDTYSSIRLSISPVQSLVVVFLPQHLASADAFEYTQGRK